MIFIGEIYPTTVRHYGYSLYFFLMYFSYIMLNEWPFKRDQDFYVLESISLGISLYFMFKIRETYNKDIEDKMMDDNLESNFRY